MNPAHPHEYLAACLLALAALAFSAPSAAQATDKIHPVYLNDADLEAVKRLVEAGADVNARLPGGATALHQLITVSAKMGMDGLMIVDKKIVVPGAWGATGHEAVAEYLVSQGADVNARDDAGMAPLHVAALTGHVAAVRFLLGHGAELDALDGDGNSAVYWAEWSATDQAIEELAAATGARINANGVKRRADKVLEALREGGAR